MIEHELAPILRAIADGKTIQMQGRKGDWSDIHTPNSPNIYLSNGSVYRVKPEMKKYRVALLTYGTETVDTERDSQTIEKNHGFLHWLTDWVEYEDGSS